MLKRTCLSLFYPIYNILSKGLILYIKINLSNKESMYNILTEEKNNLTNIASKVQKSIYFKL